MSLKKRVPWLLLAILLLALIPRLTSFKPYIDSWDGGEYAFSVSMHHLPHFPYPVFVWLGMFFSLFMPTDIALSFMSLIGGTLSILLIYYIVQRLLGKGYALVASLIFAFIPLTIHFSTFQEIYGIYLFFALSSLAILLSSHRYRILFSGLLFGISIGIHVSSVFLLPLIAYLLYTQSSGSRMKNYLKWFGSMLVVPLVSWAWMLFHFASWAGIKGGMIELYKYAQPMLRAQVSGKSYADITPLLLWKSFLRCIVNIKNNTMYPLLFFLAMLGGIYSLIRKRRIFLFGFLYLAPFLIYETLQQATVDPGAHTIYIAPAFVLFSSLIIVDTFRLLIFRKRIITILTRSVLLGILLFLFIHPDLGPLPFKCAKGLPREEVRYEGLTISDCRWIEENIPEESRIMVFDTPWIIPYYTSRWPLFVYDDLKPGHKPHLSFTFNKGNWSPGTYWERCDDNKLTKLLESGLEVFTPREDPFARASNIDPEKFKTTFYKTNGRINLYRVEIIGKNKVSKK